MTDMTQMTYDEKNESLETAFEYLLQAKHTRNGINFVNHIRKAIAELQSVDEYYSEMFDVDNA
jgi:hypothetical protein